MNNDNINNMDNTEVILKRMSKLPNEIILKIIEEYEYINYMKDMEVCNRCGNIWDGYAQCLCLNYLSEDNEEDDKIN